MLAGLRFIGRPGGRLSMTSHASSVRSHVYTSARNYYTRDTYVRICSNDAQMHDRKMSSLVRFKVCLFLISFSPASLLPDLPCFFAQVALIACLPPRHL